MSSQDGQLYLNQGVQLNRKGRKARKGSPGILRSGVVDP